MQKLIAIKGRTVVLSNPKPATDVKLGSFSVTTITEITAAHSNCHSMAVLIDRLEINCKYSGAFGTFAYTAFGKDSIVASTARVKCEGKSILAAGDMVTVTVTGPTTTGGTTQNPAQKATVDATLVDPGQTNVFANKI